MSKVISIFKIKDYEVGIICEKVNNIISFKYLNGHIIDIDRLKKERWVYNDLRLKLLKHIKKLKRYIS